tara:strand:- start:1009 stop:1218 length:210 start_codon:yes stop_codon:yes gene_type:complete
MGEAKRRKELGLPPREKTIEIPTLDKEAIQKKVRNMLEQNPIIPFLFYGAALAALFGGLFYVAKLYKII